MILVKLLQKLECCRAGGAERGVAGGAAGAAGAGGPAAAGRPEGDPARLQSRLHVTATGLRRRNSCAPIIVILVQLQTSLADQKEVNAQLSGYIDNVLLNIMDKYPELLEVKQAK